MSETIRADQWKSWALAALDSPRSPREPTPEPWPITDWDWCPFAAAVIDRSKVERPEACACGVPHDHDALFIRPTTPPEPTERNEG